MKKPVYCIDANVIIQGRKHRYPPKRFPVVWQNIEQLIDEGRICASMMVKDELVVAEDEIRDWAKGRHGLFVPVDKAQTDVVTQIQKDFEDLVDHRKRKSGADPFVIALAKVRGCTVVTLESKTGTGQKPKIPNVCDRYHIPWTNLVGMFDQEDWTFN
jgi:hypothetical protein